MLEFGIGSVLILICVFITVSLAIIVHLGGRTSEAKAFAIAMVSVFVWLVNMLILTALPEGSVWGDLVDRLSYITGLFIALTFFYFCVIFSKLERQPNLFKKLIFFGLFMGVVLLTTDVLIGESSWRGEVEGVGIQAWGTESGMMPFVYYRLVLGCFLFYLFI